MPLSTLKVEKLKRQAASTAVLVAILLCALKTFGAFYTGSLAVLSSLIDSLSDVVASVITFTAVRFSTKPATCEHRYGYGRAESISALAQATFIAGSGFFVMYDAFWRLVEPQELSHSVAGIWIMVISLVLTICLIIFQRRVAHLTKSKAIVADSAHYMVDVLTNLAIIFSLIATKIFHCAWFDTFAALGVSAYLIYQAYWLGKDALGDLTDRELKPEIRAKALDALINIKGVLGVHDLRTRDLGGIYYFEVHLEMNGHLTLSEAHKISTVAEKKLEKIFKNAQVIIHQDPAGIRETRLDDTLNGKCSL